MTQHFEHGFVATSRATLHCVSSGPADAPALLLLHGWPQTWYMWRGVIPALAEAGYRVIAVDLTGLGDSTRPTDGYDKMRVARDMAELMAALGHDRFGVVAHDWGGPVAFALAAQFPENVSAMAIFDAPVLGDGGPIEHHNRWHFGFHALPGLPEALTEGREDIYLRFMFRAAGARPDAIAEEAQAEYVRAYSQPGAMTARFNYYRAVPQDIADNSAFRVRPDTGDADPCLWRRSCNPQPRNDRVGKLVARGPQCLWGVAENCGHWIPEERPEWVAQEILRFLDNRTGPRPGTAATRAGIAQSGDETRW
ncbi:MAG: alpha/beta hydrolase [Sphingomonadales bacterium]|nr:alpha/beta hydrolase [Sphingomonadales bacterium]